MKIWISRLAIGFSVLVILGATGAWVKRDYIIGQFLAQISEQRRSMYNAFPVQAADVVMLGDSITAGGYWSEMFPAMPIKNRGIEGDTTTDVIARLDAISNADAAAVFIKIGTNDLTHGPDERSVSYAQYRLIVSSIRDGSPNTALFLQSIFPRGIEYREEVEEFNREILAIADEYGATYLDFYPIFMAPDGSIRDELTGDELHLTGDGYQLWKEQLAPSMSAYGYVPGT